MAFATDPSERNNIDNVLRLPGLKFPKGKLVIGKKNVDLMLALGAIDPKQHRAGKQLVVVQRLCILYQAIISVYEDGPGRDIDHERFYEIALLNISDKHRDMARYLTPESLRHVIDLYRMAFARSGWKVIREEEKPIIKAQWLDITRRDAGQPNGKGDKESTAGETIMETIEETTEVLEPIEPVGARVKLEKLVKHWMVIRGGKRARPKPDYPEIAGPVFPEQKPDESAYTYILRVKEAFRELRQENKHLEYAIAKRTEMHHELRDRHMDIEFEIEEKDRRIAELELQLGADGDR